LAGVLLLALRRRRAVRDFEHERPDPRKHCGSECP
jgi:hypothetical protein